MHSLIGLGIGGFEGPSNLIIKTQNSQISQDDDNSVSKSSPSVFKRSANVRPSSIFDKTFSPGGKDS